MLTRAEHPEQPPVVEVEPGFRVLHVDAGPVRAGAAQRAPRSRRRRSPTAARECSNAAARLRRAARELLGVGRGRPPAQARARPAARHHVPHARPGEGRGRARRRRSTLRPRVEAEVVRCADLVVASTRRRARPARAPLRRRSRADRDRPARASTTTCSPPATAPPRARTLGARRAARSLLFVGRIQPLKGADLAVRALAELARSPRRRCVDRRRPERPRRRRPSSRALHALVAELGLEHRVRFVAPQPHDQLADYYRAADVCVVPSRTESFGLVALEAAACGTPVVAANVGGLAIARRRRRHRLPRRRARRRRRSPTRSSACCTTDHARDARATRCATSSRYRWSIAAARLRRHYDDLAARALVQCSELRPVDPDSSTSTPAHELVAAPPRGPGRRRGVRPDRRVRPRAAPLVRALQVRRPRRDHDLLRSAPAHAALRGVLPAHPARAPPRALRVPAASATTRCTARASRSVPTATSTSSVASRSSTSPIDELDRIIGVLYELTERWFQPVVQLAYPRR